MIAAADLVSDFVGVVHRLDDGVAARDDPGLFQTYAQLAQTARLGFAPIEANAGGIAFTAAEARAAAFGEAVERYAAAFVPPERLVSATARELGVAGDVGRYRRFGSGSDHGRDIEADTRLDWVRGYNLTARRPTWVPAHLTFLVASRDGWGHTPHTTSTGLAAGPDAWSALRGAVLECVERDAFMTTWLGRRAPMARYRWKWSQLQPIGAAMRRWVPQRYELYRLHAAVEDVVVVMGVARGGPGQPAVAVGAAASLDALTACRKALREAHQSFAWARVLQARGMHVAHAADIDDLDAHVAYYLEPSRITAFDFLDATDVPIVELPDAWQHTPGPHTVEHTAERDVGEIVAGLAARDISVAAVDVTTPDLRQCGLWVIRAVVPELYPLVIEHGLVLPAHPRLADVDAANPDPHPFP